MTTPTYAGRLRPTTSESTAAAPATETPLGITRATALNGNHVGNRVELARYTIPAGERVLHGQRINGVVRFLPGEDVVLVQPSGGSEDTSCRFPVVGADPAHPLGGSGEPIGEES